VTPPNSLASRVTADADFIGDAALARELGRRLGAAVNVSLLHGIDPLQAVPIEEFRTTTALHRRRWPQVQKAASDKRRKLGALMARRRAARPKR
jgi:hypothetical protein